MDLPPPPPPPPFRLHHERHHLRYGNVLQPPNFIPPHNLSPPPPPPPRSYPPPHIFLPPPPPLPPPSDRFTFFPPHHSIHDRSNRYKFDSPPKPYLNRNLLPPPPPRENLVSPIIHDYQNPISKDEVFNRGYNGNSAHDLPKAGGNFQLGRREVSPRVLAVGDHERYCRRYDDGVRGWDNGMSVRVRNDDDDVRGWDKGISARFRDDDYVRRLDTGVIDRGHELYYERDGNETRWDGSVNNWVHELCNARVDDEMRWGIGSNDRCRELHHKRDVERRCDIGSDDQGRELYCEVDDGGKRWDYGSNGGVFSRLGNMRKKPVESEPQLGRFSLWGRDSKGGIIRPSTKRRKLKERVIEMQPGKACNWHSEGYKCRHLSKVSSSGNSTRKDRERFECLDAKMEETGEREQSPVELAISFKANSLVAKAIVDPTFLEVKMEKQLTPRNMNIGEVNSVQDMVKTDLMTHGLDFRSESQGISEDLLDKSTVSRRETPAPINVDDLGENAVKSEPQKDMKVMGSNNVGSRRRRARMLRKKRRAEKRHLRETSLNMSKDNGEIINANSCIDNLSVDPRLNSSTIDSEKVDVSSDSYRPSVPDLKRKTRLLNIADNVITGRREHAERLVTATEDADDVCQLETDEVAGHASETFLPNETTDANNVDISVINMPSLLNSEEHTIEPIDRFTCTNMVNDSIEHPFDGGLVFENAFVKGPSEIIVSSSTEGCDISGSQQDKLFSEIHESDSISGTDNTLLEPNNVVVSDVSSVDANSKEFFPNQVKVSEIVVNPEDLRTVEITAVSGCSNLSLDPLPANSKGTLAEFDISFLDTMSKKSFYDAIGSPEAINKVKTARLSIDCSSEIERKRKSRDDSTMNVIPGTVPIDGEVARVLENGVEVHISGKKDNCKEDDRLDAGPSGAEELTMDVDIGSDCFSKKRKLNSPTWTQRDLSEDDFITNSLTRDCSKLDQGSVHREDIPSSASIYTNRSGNAGRENKAGLENCYVADMDKFMADGNKLQHTNDDMANEDGNDVFTDSSDDELLASGLDMPYYMSSPEDLLSHSDFSSLRNTEASASQSKDQTISGRDKMSVRKPVPAAGRSLEKAALHKLQTNSQIPHNSKVAPKLNLVNGKLTVYRNQSTSTIPKTFPHRPPINFNSSNRFPSNLASKSRTWHRTDISTVAATTEPKLQHCPPPQSHGPKMAKPIHSSYVRKGNSLVRKPSPSGVAPSGLHGLSSSVYRRSPSTDNLKKSPPSDISNIVNVDDPTVSKTPVAVSLNQSETSLGALEDTIKLIGNSDRHSATEEQISRKKITYVKKKSYQLVAASDSEVVPVLGNTKAAPSDGYYKKRKNQLVRSPLENHVKEGDVVVKGNTYKRGSPAMLLKSSNKRLLGFPKTYKSSKVSFVWKLHDAKSLGKHKNLVEPQKVWPYLFPWRKATYRRSFMHALGSKPNNSSFFTNSQKLLLSRKRGAIYTRSTHGYSLRMSKVLSVGGSSLKWSKSIERTSKKANEDATRAVAAATLRKKEGTSVPVVSKSRNHVSSKWVLSLKLRPGRPLCNPGVAFPVHMVYVSVNSDKAVLIDYDRERIFRIGSERYKMDPTRRTLQRITAEKEQSHSVLQSDKNVKRLYVPRRLLIGNNEYVRIGNGNQLVRDPKKRTRILASEKVKWSLRTARLRLARKRKYCQFFTRFGKCNKDDGKCPYIHDPSKIAVCTKFLNGSCSDQNCKLTHKIIPERMQDCSYFMKGSCSNESCPYRHVNIDPDSTVCESFLRGYCADASECWKKHTYVCPAFEATGNCPQVSTCKLHHPKKKVEMSKPATTEQQKIVRGRYFDGGLIEVADVATTTEVVSAKGKEGTVGCQEGKFPDYISLDVTDDIVCED